MNDTYIWAMYAASALELSLQSAGFLVAQHFRVPSRNRAREVPRKPRQIKEFLHNAAKRDLFSSVFVSLVAEMEAFLVSVCKSVLRYDSRRLKTRVPGIDHINRVDTTEIIDAGSRDELIEMLIEREIQAVLYSRPAAYFSYMEKVIGISLQEDLREEWVEIKATRDIIVHNSSIVNRTYIDKSGDKARGALGTVIPFDRSYFEESIATMKSIAGSCEVSLRKAL